MRKLRQFSMVAVLMTMLATYALAGTIDTPPAPTPEPSVTTPGTIDTPPSEAASIIPVADIALELLLSVL